MLNLGGDFPAFLVIYVFSGQMADPVIKMQIENGIKIVRVPGNITPISAARSHSQWFCKSVYETKANWIGQHFISRQLDDNLTKTSISGELDNAWWHWGQAEGIYY